MFRIITKKRLQEAMDEMRVEIYDHVRQIRSQMLCNHGEIWERRQCLVVCSDCGLSMEVNRKEMLIHNAETMKKARLI